MAKKIICIDAGHYGKYNGSPVVPAYYESDMVWKLHKMQEEILEGYGFEVVTTRSNQATDRGLYDRGYAAKDCVLFISNHSNACGTESIDYPVVYRGYDNIGNCDALALKLAKVIESVMGTKQSGRTATRKDSSGGEYYGVLRGARAAGLSDYYILEHSFHTNIKMTEWLQDESNLRKLAEAECKVIAKHYGVSKEDDKDSMTKITGKAQATAEQMQAYMKSKNPNVSQSVIDMIPLYLAEGEAENIRGDIAFAQSCLETGNFGFSGSAVELSQNNFCGMGVTENGMKGNSFASPQFGIRAQIQHLKAYANTTKLKGECVDPRFDYVSRGSASYVEYLGIQENPKGKGWASGAGYGVKILNILEAIKAIEKEDDEPMAGSPMEEEALYTIQTTCDTLNIRVGAGTGHPVVGVIREANGSKKDYTIVEEQGGWGRLKSRVGWISLTYAKKSYVGDSTEIDLYTIQTTCDVLNIRAGAGAEHPVVGVIREANGSKKDYTIVEEKSGWGRLKSGAGWIRLSYTKSKAS